MARLAHPTVLDQRTIVGSVAPVLVKVVLIFLTAAVLVLSARRVSGEFDTPLSSVLVAGLGFVGILAALAAGLGDPFSKNRASVFKPRVGRLLWVTILFLVAASLTVPGTNHWALGLLWLSAGVSVSLLVLPQWLTFTSRIPVSFDRTLGKTLPPTQRGPAPNVTRKFLLTPIEVKRGQRAAAAPFAKVVGDDKLIGQQIQEQAADGTLIVRGCLRVSFQTGQRTAIAHIAFCPAFVELPVVQATVRDPDRQNGESRIKIAQVVPQGVRFEVKLSRAADSKVFVIVDFTAMGLGSVCQ